MRMLYLEQNTNRITFHNLQALFIYLLLFVLYKS